jgi:hypothetical protein
MSIKKSTLFLSSTTSSTTTTATNNQIFKVGGVLRNGPLTFYAGIGKREHMVRLAVVNDERLGVMRPLHTGRLRLGANRQKSEKDNKKGKSENGFHRKEIQNRNGCEAVIENGARKNEING